jgi:putative membrane protein
MNKIHMKIIIHWFFRALAIMAAAYLFPGIMVRNFLVALIVALVLGFLNMFIRPILIILTLPITIVTLGLFTFVINALLVLLTSAIVPGFFVAGFRWALFLSLILSVINAIIFHHENVRGNIDE